MKEYTRFRNKNRGYMTLRVWHRAIDLYKLVCRIVYTETLSRAIAFRAAEQLSESQFQELDTLHYEVENGLWKLLESLEKKRDEGSWVTRASDSIEDYHPE